MTFRACFCGQTTQTSPNNCDWVVILLTMPSKLIQPKVYFVGKNRMKMPKFDYEK